MKRFNLQTKPGPRYLRAGGLDYREAEDDVDWANKEAYSGRI